MSRPSTRKLQKKAQRREKIRKRQNRIHDRFQNEERIFDIEDALETDEPERAARLCRTALASEPNNRFLLSLYSMCLKKLQRHDLLCPVLEKLIMQYPENGPLHHDYLLCLFYLERYEEVAVKGKEFLGRLSFPREMRKRLRELVDYCRNNFRPGDKGVPDLCDSGWKTGPAERTGTTVSAVAADSGETPAGKDEMVRLENPPIVLKIADYSFASHWRMPSPPVRSDSFTWLQLLLRWEHERMRSSFEELLCGNRLTGITHFGYQTETVRKVLKVFHGRVLLADEVGLGKTIEAGMVLKEYLLRGMASSVLVLCPPSLVGQWTSELKTKFDIRAYAHQAGGGSGRERVFGRHDIIVASLHTAKTAANARIITGREWDMVIVDEAHHLRNKRTLSWKLVNAIRKKFLLLLSATPVQNNLVELYHLITLLKPGTFPPEKTFLDTYCDPKNRRKPKNSDSLRLLLRDVMIRNTRAGCGVRFPKRYAVTFRVSFTEEEQRVYDAMSALAHRAARIGTPLVRMSLRRLLERAGAHPPLSAAPLRNLSTLLRSGKVPVIDDSAEDLASAADNLLQAVEHLPESTGKIEKLVSILREGNRRTIVFCRHSATVDLLAAALSAAGFDCAPYHAAKTIAERSGVIERFREGGLQVLVCSETGGEGHNLQFCNSLVNFDLPWNPMQIEQRIGRIHRIGQENDIFIFNLCYSGAIEERILDILESKIRMFELVIGEVDSILGSLDEKGGFSEAVMDLWVQHPERDARSKAFSEFGDELAGYRERYLETCRIDEELFGREIEA